MQLQRTLCLWWPPQNVKSPVLEKEIQHRQKIRISINMNIWTCHTWIWINPVQDQMLKAALSTSSLAPWNKEINMIRMSLPELGASYLKGHFSLYEPRLQFLLSCQKFLFVSSYSGMQPAATQLQLHSIAATVLRLPTGLEKNFLSL